MLLFAELCVQRLTVAPISSPASGGVCCSCYSSAGGDLDFHPPAARLLGLSYYACSDLFVFQPPERTGSSPRPTAAADSALLLCSRSSAEGTVAVVNVSLLPTSNGLCGRERGSYFHLRMVLFSKQQHFVPTPSLTLQSLRARLVIRSC